MIMQRTEAAESHLFGVTYCLSLKYVVDVDGVSGVLVRQTDSTLIPNQPFPGHSKGKKTGER